MQMTIRLPDDYKERIDIIAAKTGLKKSDIARLALQRFLETFEKEALEERPARRAHDLMGVVNSGIPDLGTNHRKHLTQKMRGQKY